ncbi:fimbrin [Rhizophagus irregularis]|uniref:Fimbrin n=4 Tax=Rhizophagus irregularis TaxID=588596 RepID=A0A2I1E4M2_9GLOM|nr:fimbrin [Rhizophagus irregularis DAOM 181602=DAOM 197198]EXX69494.1 Sac6p [Rhizophagus irregularis DAOM 197198w]PKC59741.1 fimbrin [Rhizophagus irregularis]PKK70462.1 fimbrin [Rhizophagus irregularis]PKY17072.1 fimbrin [Rhizophagus irregularis]POG78334.1 fimbrin [Rhizophagus irregularis DAOM 181602=DAOM 197198]|eukprot:XP_025185200.1 fimbrin [Rhizophagus irregularis DAOM 181602=DAOM 197198]
MNAIQLAKKYPQISQQGIFDLVAQFNKIDLDGNGALEQKEVVKALQEMGESNSYDEIRATLKEINLSSTGNVELDEFVELIVKLREGRNKSAFAVNKHKITVHGTSRNVSHTINEDERTEFTRHINQALAGDPHVSDKIPIDTNTMQLFDECKDGLILAKLINDSVSDTIDERVLNVPGKGKKINKFKMTENNNLVIFSAKGIGCNVVNIGSADLIEGREHLILGLIWQIIKIGLLNKIDIKLHPELYRLLEDDETLEQFLKLPPDQILLRWFNYHLKAAKWDRRVTNFSTDVKDGENYTVLLNQLKPEICSREPLNEPDLLERAEKVLQNAEKLGCRKYLTPKALVTGNPKLNLAFVAHLFNTHPCLDPLDEEEKAELEEFDDSDDREARVFALWLNSLDVTPAVNNLYEDVKDGLILLQAFDKIVPNTVNWKKVNKSSNLSRFKQVENTNYAITIGKDLRFTLVNIQGADICDGTKTLILGLVWQMMRMNIIQTLTSLSKGGRDITDNDLIKWANDTVSRGGKSSKISSFKDPALRNGIFLIDLLDSIKPGIVDYSLVTKGVSDDDATLNARYAISIARKIGATIFLLPEDIVEVRPRLILTFIGSLMALK